MAANTVEATLRSKYEDGVSSAVAQTQRIMQQNLGQLQNAGALMASGIGGAFDAVISKTSDLQQYLERAANSSEGSFKRISLGAAAMAVGVAAGVLAIAKSVGSYIFDLVKESSEITELKLAFEGLANSTGRNVDLFPRLKAASEGLIASTDLLKNANRVMASGIDLSSDSYVKLVENITRMAKASGVDASQAVNTLTDSLIRGNARGLQAIGLHINVKDAISEMAAASGEAANKLGDTAKMQSFYNELLQKTTESASRLPEQFISLQDALTRGERAWKSYLVSFGEGINRSQVFQELIKKFVESLDSLSSKSTDVDKLALATNRFFIGFLSGAAGLLELVAPLVNLIALLRHAIESVVDMVGLFSTMVFVFITAIVTGILELLSLLPGAAGKAFKGAADQARYWMDYYSALASEFGKGIAGNWSGFGQTGDKMNALAASSRGLAAEMSKFVDQTVKAGGALQNHNAGVQAGAESQKKLNDELKAYNDLRRGLAGRTETPSQRNLSQLIEDFTRINALDLSMVKDAEEKKNQLRIQALRAFEQEKRKIDQKEIDDRVALEKEGEDLMRQISTKDLKSTLEEGAAFIDEVTGETVRRNAALVQATWDKLQQHREEERQKETSRIISTANTVARAVEMAQSGKLSSSVGQESLSQIPAMVAQIRTQIAALESQKVVTPEQLDQLTKLHEALEKLNTLNMSPLKAMIGDLHQSLVNMANATTNAFSQFWSDMVSGQKDSGKKFLAAMLDMVANELMIRALRLTALAIDRACHLDFAGAAQAAAGAAAMAALGGTLKGIATSMTSSASSSSASSSSGSSSQSSNSSAPQVISVGRPNSDQASAQSSQPKQLGIITLRLDRGVVVDEVKTNIQNNGVLRTMIQKVHA